MFAIEFSPDLREAIAFGERAAYGVIAIEDFRERFVAPLVFWSAADYERQWRDAVRRLVGGEPRACFVTAMRDPALGGVGLCWPAYRVGDAVHLQNRLLFFAEIGGTFDPFEPEHHLGERRTTSEDGGPISEWRVPIEAIERFRAETEG